MHTFIQEVTEPRRKFTETKDSRDLIEAYELEENSSEKIIQNYD